MQLANQNTVDANVLPHPHTTHTHSPLHYTHTLTPTLYTHTHPYTIHTHTHPYTIHTHTHPYTEAKGPFLLHTAEWVCQEDCSRTTDGTRLHYSWSPW